MLKRQLGGLSNDEIKKTDEGKAFMKAIEKLGPSGLQMKDLDKIIKDIQGPAKKAAQPRRQRAI